MRIPTFINVRNISTISQVSATTSGGGGPITSQWTPFDFTITATTTAPDQPSNKYAAWLQIGDFLTAKYYMQWVGSGYSTGAGSWLFSLPTPALDANIFGDASYTAPNHDGGFTTVQFMEPDAARDGSLDKFSILYYDLVSGVYGTVDPAFFVFADITNWSFYLTVSYRVTNGA